MKFRSLKLYAIMAGTLLFVTTSCQKEEDLSIPDDISNLTNMDGQIIPDQYIVVFKDEASKDLSFKTNATYAERTETAKNRIKNILAVHSIAETVIERTYSSSVFGFSGELNASELDELRKDPNVAYIEQNRSVALGLPSGKNPESIAQYGASDQEIPYGVARVGGPMDGTGKTAWVIDSGIDMDHPDLNVDASRSASFTIKGRNDTSPDDTNGHGTHIAGTIAAVDNNIGVVGIAAGATVVAVKVLDKDGKGTYAAVINGIDYVAANGVSGDVVTMGVGGPASSVLDAAVISAASHGIIFCIAAGNEGVDVSNLSPARIMADNVYVISAIDETDAFASFSNYGNPVSNAGPGVGILSTYKGGGRTRMEGTSSASAHAAGVLLMSNGNPRTDGTVIGDPDGNHDMILHLQ